MKKNTAAVLLLLFCIHFNGEAQNQISNSNSTFMIRHTVVFSLKHARGSVEEKKFLDEIQKLSSIPGVKKFIEIDYEPYK